MSIPKWVLGSQSKMKKIISKPCSQQGMCSIILSNDSEGNIRLYAAAVKAECLTRHTVLLSEDTWNTQSAFSEIIAFINCNYTGQ